MRVLGKLKAEPGIWMYEAPMPDIGVNDVLIKIKKTAICGTDLHIYHWDEWAQKNIKVPLITGHEYSGEIVAVGEWVKGFNIGDRVSGEGHLNCGFCRNCRAGKRHLCRNHTSVGVFRQGAFAEYLSIPATNAFRIPDQVSDDVASILDPMGNATHTALSFDLVGEDVLITGAGPVGIMAAAIARHAGARHVVITDINDYRLALAKRIGATQAVNINHTSIRDVMKSLEIKEGFDVGLEMSGNPKAFNMMIDTMIHGGRIALLGFLPHDTQVEWSQFVLKGLFLKGVYGREMYETWYKMVSMLQSGLDVTPVITHHFPASEYQAAFEVMSSGQSGKVILNWEE